MFCPLSFLFYLSFVLFLLFPISLFILLSSFFLLLLLFTFPPSPISFSSLSSLLSLPLLLIFPFPSPSIGPRGPLFKAKSALLATLNDSDDDEIENEVEVEDEDESPEGLAKDFNRTPTSSKRNVHFGSSTDVDNVRGRMSQGSVLFDPPNIKDVSPPSGIYCTPVLRSFFPPFFSFFYFRCCFIFSSRLWILGFHKNMI